MLFLNIIFKLFRFFFTITCCSNGFIFYNDIPEQSDITYNGNRPIVIRKQWVNKHTHTHTHMYGERSVKIEKTIFIVHIWCVPRKKKKEKTLKISFARSYCTLCVCVCGNLEQFVKRIE